MIEVDERFEVAAPPATVWPVMADPRAVVGCVPGAEITAVNEDGSLELSVGVKFGPLNIAFQAHADLELDAAAMQGRISARGRDKQGGARFAATATFGVAPDGQGSLVTINGGVEMSGRLASMIEAGATIVVKRISADFANCLRQRCAAP